MQHSFALYFYNCNCDWIWETCVMDYDQFESFKYKIVPFCITTTCTFSTQEEQPLLFLARH